MTPVSSPLSAQQMLQQAAAHHEAGRLVEAERLYRQILASDANHIQANYNLGVLLLQRQQYVEAQPFFLIALHGDPAREQCWLACIEVLLQIHAFAEARSALIQAQQALGPSAALMATEQRLAQLEAEQLVQAPNGSSVVDVDALFSEVIALVGQQRFVEAEPLAQHLLERCPQHFFAWQAFGVVLEGLGRYTEALDAMQRAATLQPDDPEVNFNLGNLYKALGCMDDAEASYLAALAVVPDWAAVHGNLAALYIAMGQPEQAEASYRQALQAAEDNPEAHNGLGVVLSHQGRHEEAEACFRRALALKPDYAVACSSLAVTLAACGRLDEAEASYREALKLNPEHAESHANLAVLLERRGCYDEAMSCCRRSLAIDPDQPMVLANLANLLARRGQLQEAEELCQRAIELQPDCSRAHLSLGNVLRKAGRHDEAEHCWQQVLELDPECLEANQIRLFGMTHDARVSAEDLYRAHRTVGELLEVRAPAFASPHGCTLEPERPLRIGFVSGDLRSHPVALFLEPILSHLDPHAFTLYAYSNHPAEDVVSARLRELVSVWRPVVELDDMALAERIRTDAIDILFDLSGYTGYNRLPVFAMKPAPLQVSWIGYPATTGLRSVDYYLLNGHRAPAGLLDRQFTEKLVQLPSMAAFQPLAEAPEVNALPALQRGSLTFGSFNRMSKLNDYTLTLWCRVLQAVPDARLLIGSVEDEYAEELCRRFLEQGIGQDRLTMHPRLGLADYLKLHHEVDILLDTFPYAGGTTTHHGFSMGVPTLTLPGETLPSRVGAGLSQALELDEFIAADEDDFVAKAVAWSRNFAGLAQIRAGLRERVAQHGSGAHERVVAGLELALRQMWRQYCAGEAPVSFEVTRAAVEDHLLNRVCDAPAQLPKSEELANLQRLFEAGRYVEGEAEARALTRNFPRQTFGWTALIVALRGLGRQADLLEPLSRLAELQPLDAGAHANLGIQQLNLGSLTEAEASLRKALELDAKHIQAWHALGHVLKARGCFAEAEHCYCQALAVMPSQVRVANSLGVLLNEQGGLADAEDVYCRALQHAPDYAPLLSNRGKNLQESGLLAESEACLRRALALQPDYVEAHCNLAIVLTQQGRLLEAEACARQALRLRPGFSRAWLNLSVLIARQGRLAEAMSELRELLAVDPHNFVARSDLLFHMTHDASVTAEALFAEHCRFGELLEGQADAHATHANTRDMQRRLRIGFVSADLRSHPVAHFLEPVLRHLDRSSFDIYAYSNHSLEDAITLQLRGLVSTWRKVIGMNDAVLAAQIREDGIDILFDLSGHTGGNRLPVFAMKPAPLQVSWIGYPATTGLRSVDYYLLNGHRAPAGLLDRQFTEKLVQLPSIAAFQPLAEAPEVNALPALQRGSLTFGSFNRMSKLNDYTLTLWCRVLQAVPDARLLIGSVEDEYAEELSRRFLERGIGRDRLTMHPRLDLADYLRLHHEVDILLDTFPYAGGTTTHHGFSMGVPTLTLPGETLPSRVGAGLSQALELDEFIAEDEDDFVAKAVAWSRNLSGLAQIRAGLRGRVAQHGSGAHERVVAGLELALRQMWRQYCAAEAPVSFEVTRAAVDDYLLNRMG